MDIRLAQNRDIPGIIGLLRQVGDVHHQIRPDIFRSGAQKYSESNLEALLKDPARPVFAAVEGDTLLGYCFCIHRDYRGSGVLTDRLEVYIDDLCVDRLCRGQGVASALYRHVCDHAKSLGCAFVTLNVWCGNDGAMQFYKKMGLTARSITMEAKL